MIRDVIVAIHEEVLVRDYIPWTLGFQPGLEEVDFTWTEIAIPVPKHDVDLHSHVVELGVFHAIQVALAVEFPGCVEVDDVPVIVVEGDVVIDTLFLGDFEILLIYRDARIDDGDRG